VTMNTTRFVQESRDSIHNELGLGLTGDGERAQRDMNERKVNASRSDKREASKGRLFGEKGGDPTPPDNSSAVNSARINAEAVHPNAEAARKKMDAGKRDAWKKRPARIDRQRGERAQGGGK
jgi:hypothetical protein